ncbi:hypothetical protein CCO03_10535 [Comamonas serinivorans]|uniref:DUF4132 domain-containing protein n=1 Tax=Comamonas serinivorans TaxID=1082851 RepID=A0A1Y0EP22_9BURK|nr:DUF4132 domain-containing protein [Comamonas serinivorans]ARU05069.1 hypothetical protein CCO03_10535 [Comamonas serinivorans]
MDMQSAPQRPEFPIDPVAWLENPPWRQPTPKTKPRASKAAKALHLTDVPPLAPQLRWSEVFEAAAAQALETGSEVEQLAALGVDLADFQDEDQVELVPLRQALAARDADAVAQTLRELNEKISPYWARQPLQEFDGDGRDWLKLGDLAAPLWNRLAARYVHAGAAAFVPALGLAGLPAMEAWCARSLASAIDLALCMASEPLARSAGLAVVSGKAHAIHGKAWLKAWPEYAAAAHLPDALCGKGKAQTVARTVLLWLVDEGLRESVLAGAQRLEALGHAGALQATHELLADDPLLRYPTRVGELPEFWPQLAAHAPQWVQGGTLSSPALQTLGEMLSFPAGAGRYAGLALVREACTPESLAAFAWALMQAWEADRANRSVSSWRPREPGAELLKPTAKYDWAFWALGVLGNDQTARDLAKCARVWPTEGLSARAGTALEILAEMGTDVALGEIAAIAERVKSRPLKLKAQEMMRKIGLMRGLSAQDLEDRLVPTLGLNTKGERVLDFGPRQFLLRLDEQLKPQLRALEDGRPGARVAKLPAVGARDDAALASAATAAYKAVAKQTKAIGASHIKRLEKAMREQRRWTPDDFQVVYVQHPVLRQIAARVIWGLYAPAQPGGPARPLAAFRVAADGELLQADEAPLVWPDVPVKVGVVHPLQLDAATLAAFGQVFVDYELLQPFEQLGRQVARDLTAEQAVAAVLAWDGKALEPLRVLGLDARGWDNWRDSGFICSYQRSLPGQRQVTLDLEPGVALFSPRDSGAQTLHLRLTQQGQPQDWRELDPITLAELLRDLEHIGG